MDGLPQVDVFVWGASARLPLLLACLVFNACFDVLVRSDEAHTRGGGAAPHIALSSILFLF